MVHRSMTLMGVLSLALAGQTFGQDLPPGGWTGSQTIGGGTDGSAVAVEKGVYEVTGNGVDIWGTSDQFHYLFKELTGDGAVSSRVVDNGTGSNAWSKGGIMIRDTLDPDAAHIDTIVTGGNGGGAIMQWRPSVSSTSQWAGGTGTPPMWIRLERVGDDFTTLLSNDGDSWTQVGDTQTIPMTDPVLIGLCVTSHASGELRTYTFDNVRFEGDVTGEIPPGTAHSPTPVDESSDVPRDLLLTWALGEYVDKHNLYMGTVFDDVNDATVDGPRDVLIGQRLANNSFDPGRLDFNQTYYWRVDEVNGAPDFTVFKGNVWRFTTELFSYPVVPVTATASSAHIPAMGPEKTIDGSGLNAADQHSISGEDMWLTAGSDTERWIQYEFTKPQKLHEMWVWNSNQAIESFVGFGAKTVSIETSIDGTTWTTLADVPEFAQASGAPDYNHNTVVDFGGVSARYVKLAVSAGWGLLPQFGLSEVRFFAIPVYAREPQPAVGAVDLPTEVVLGWRAGREAAMHEVYLGTDPNVLSLVGQTTDTSYNVSVDLDQTQYWRVDEVNDAQNPAPWEGDLWQFSSALYTVIDDMESYRDAEFEEIWATWIDGFEDTANGALIGNGPTGAPETDIVYDGRQSMPYHYGQGGASVSETTRAFDQPMDWSKSGVRTLSLMFYGDPGNTPGQLYVGINGNRVVDYPGAVEDMKHPQWHLWQIDLRPFGITVVNRLTLGVQGGSGILRVDAIRLYPTEGVSTTPVIPDDSGLVAYYPLNSNTQDMSGNGRDGAAVGAPLYVDGPAGLGSGLRFDGSGAQYVNLGTWDPSATTGQLTLSMWTQWSGISGQWQGLIGKRDSWAESGMMWDLEAHRDTGVMRFGRNGSTVGSGLALIEQGEWEPWAVTFDGTTATIFRYGLSVASGPLSFGSKTDASFQLGAGQIEGGNPYNGALSEVRLYDRMLTPAEVAGLAGRTAPFQSP